jgi:hypothetical protein
MLYSTYRELVLPEEGERYWKLIPESKAENVLSFSSKRRSPNSNRLAEIIGDYLPVLLHWIFMTG